MYPQQPKSVQDTVRWIHDQDRIAMNYVKSWFPIDLISILVSGFDFLSLGGCNLSEAEQAALVAHQQPSASGTSQAGQ